MSYLSPNISYFARANFRNDGRRFGMFQHDRMMHTVISGKTGTGKTNLLTTLILQDVVHGRGCVVFDVHGDLIQTILKHVPENRVKDVIHVNVTDPHMNYCYNPVRKVPAQYSSLVVGGLLDAFQKLWKSAWGVKLEHILRFVLLTLVQQDNATLSDILNVLHNSEYRSRCLANITDVEILRFWNDEFPKYSAKSDLTPIFNKVGALLAHSSVKRLFVSNTNNLSLRKCMDERNIVLIDVSKGTIGADASHLISSILLTSFAHAAFSRVSIQEDERVPCHLFLDEFQNYMSPSISGMLSELRKFKVSMTLAHQHMHQLDPDIRNAVIGNVGTHIAFRVGNTDAKYFTSEFTPIFKTVDLINLPNYDIYLKLMINGRPSQPFSATTIPYTEILN
jgi:type IV secretory pathway VirB4 component